MDLSKYNVKEEDMKKYIDRLTDAGINEDQLDSVAGIFADIHDELQSTDMGAGDELGKPLDQIEKEYIDYVQTKRYTREERLAFVDSLVDQADSEEDARERLKVYM